MQTRSVAQLEVLCTKAIQFRVELAAFVAVASAHQDRRRAVG